jgi:hypothetical protein
MCGLRRTSKQLTGKVQENPCFYIQMKGIKEIKDMIHKTLEAEPILSLKLFF